MIETHREYSAALCALLLAVLAAVTPGRVALAHAATEAAAPAMPHIAGHFTLTTLDGRAVSDESYHGKWLVIYFGYTFCPDACPTTLNGIGIALDGLGPLAEKVRPLFITVDPGRDTVPVMTEYLKAFDPRITGLRGAPEQVEAAAKQYHVYFRTRQLGNGEYTVDHSSFIYVIAPDGRFAKLLTADLPGHQLAAELRQLIE
jgi:protein SCO1/2